MENEYSSYIQAQLKKTLGKINKNPKSRYEPFLTEFIKIYSGDFSEEIICIGCRNFYELQAFKNKGFQYVLGIDLVSDPTNNIIEMDMHNIQFEDDSFDICYAAHSLEHSYNALRVFNEIKRVTKNNGFILIEVPIGHKPSKVDRYNFIGLNNFLETFQVDLVLYSHMKEHQYADQGIIPGFVRLIFKNDKKYLLNLAGIFELYEENF